MEDLQRFQIEMLRQKDPLVYGSVTQSITYAYLRCSVTKELIGYSTDVAHPYHHLAIKALRERADKLTSADRLALVSKLNAVLTSSYRENLSPRLRSRADRLFGNVGDLIDPSTRRKIARSMCSHHLRARRKAAIRVLRQLGPLEEDVRALSDAWHSFHDPDALFVLTRVSGGLAGCDCCELLDFIPNRLADWDPAYLHAVILERLILDQEIDHEHAVKAHTVAYIRAVGRTKQVGFKGFVLLAIPSLFTPDALTLAASVAGRLGSRELIAAIEMQLAAIVDSGQPQ